MVMAMIMACSALAVLAGALQLRLHLADLGLEPVDGLREGTRMHGFMFRRGFLPKC